MSHRRLSPPPGRDAPSSSYGQGRGGRDGSYSDRRGPPPGRSYRDNYDSRGPPPPPRRSVSPPYSRGGGSGGGGYNGRSRGDERYDSRRDRDYPREAAHPPPPRSDRRDDYAAPPPPPRKEDYSGRSYRREASPPRRAERDRRVEDRRGGRDEREPAAKATTREAAESAAIKDATHNDVDNEEDGEVQNDDEQDMMAAMGFGGFGTTKNTKVDGNQSGSAEVKKERTWRQYMQRKGGFNRPLSPVRK